MIIAAALVLAGCSALRLGYDNGPRLVWWWLDGYMDFDSRQAPAVHAAIARWFAWHRANELPRYAALLQEAGAAMPQATTPEAVCRWTDRLRDAPAAAVDRALREATPLVAGLGEPQLRHLEQRYAKRLAEMREEYLQPDPAERRKASVERAVERFEELYGRLDAAQRRVVAEGVAASPWDAEAWVAERDRRQREVVQTLRRLVVERADADTTLAALRTLASRSERSADPAYREFQAKLDAYNCGFAARVHNATTAAQRERARDRLAGWERDLRSLAADAGAPAPAAVSP
ncbi:DUF6279 family lipoprotein [Rubrivivax gelatinosus]|uniref:Lipoprotein n=1 Tax=Rubrivivax gelatinosus (strain NBRC 100245 / IL144) TaxID=983917 RepID=I0HLD9_RUBGI|nr:DUF6279 family lipoprotein [Rubrivivax gelatinosus]BAL93826.1 hypothetical protein RGE_04810 [Rubrivivax gelatinosus IL144]